MLKVSGEWLATREVEASPGLEGALQAWVKERLEPYN